MVAQPLSPLEPATIAEMDGEGIDGLLARLGAHIPTEPTLSLVPEGPARTLAVIGDTHGDWRCTAQATRWFLDSPKDRAFVGLGDYIDRAPRDCPGGSAVNALHLLSLKAAYPNRVYLLQGNHEATRRLPAFPHTLPEEMAARWGEDPDRYSRLMTLLERGPLAAYTSSGIFLAHGGFPERLTQPWTDRFRTVDESLMADLLWRDASLSELDRGVSPPFDGTALDRFFLISGLAIFLRGHDPDVVGQRLYGDRCLTIHTCRLYRQYGGILTVHAPLAPAVRSLADVDVIPMRVDG